MCWSSGFRVCAAAAMVFVGGCSLLALDEDLEQASCDNADFCASLNDSNPTGDPCLAWTCGPQSVCEVLPLDLDGDGAAAMGCAPAGEEADCDDTSAIRAPLLAETCDGVDNDCDDAVDEDAALPLGSTQTLLSLPSGTIPAQASYLALPGEAVAVAYTERRAATSAPVTVDVLQLDAVSPGASAVSVQPNTLPTPNAFSSTLASVGSSVAAAAAFAGCTRVVPGLLDLQASRFGELTVDETNFAEGLPVPGGAGDETCPRVVASPVSWLTAQADGNVVLFAWLEVAETQTETCAAGISATVLLGSARLVSGALQPASATALALGTSTAPVRPSLVSLAGDGWLVGFPTSSGYALHHVTVSDGPTGALAAALVTSETLADVKELSLAAGERSGDTQALVVGLRTGCGASARVSFVRDAFDTVGGALLGGSSRGESTFTSSAGQDTPLAVFQPEPLGWLFGWREDGIPMGARIAPDGTERAGAAPLLADDSLAVFEPALLPLESEDGFALVGFDTAAGQLVGSTLRCSSP